MLRLGDDVLARISAALSDLYFVFYEERPVDPHASLTGNMLAFAFEDGLSVADEWLLRGGKDRRLTEYRGQFFEVVRDDLIGVVADHTGLAVTFSFFGFDPRTRTTHMIFVLDRSALQDAGRRRAV
jgi:uncharacterized protein YbcI